MLRRSGCLFAFCGLCLNSWLFSQASDYDLNECMLIHANDLTDPKAPKFSDYPASARGSVARPKLDLASNPIARTYRTRLRNAIAEGSNYAGHYTVALWGCGTSCVMFAVVNLESGRVVTPKSFTTVSGDHLVADDCLCTAGGLSWGLRFARDSTLLVVVGELDEDEDQTGAFDFTRRADQLVPVFKTPEKKNCPAPKK